MNRLPWLESHWRQLARQAETDRLPHALLLSGPSGVGKQELAYQLCRLLLCGQLLRDETGPAPCGHCRDCRQLAAGNHPDLMRLGPDKDEGPIRVDAVRELAGFLSRTSQRGRFKLVVLSPAEQLNANAANALLKTLEEPPSGTLLMLITTRVGRIPATVLSRCQRRVCRPPPTAAAEEWLRLQIADPDTAPLLLRLAGGAPLEARRLAAADTLTRRAALFGDWRAVLSGRGAPAETAERFSADDPAGNLDWLIGWYMDMIRLRLAPRSERFIVNADLAESLAGMASSRSLRELFRDLDGLLTMRRSLGTPLNLQLQFEAWLAEVSATTRPAG